MEQTAGEIQKERTREIEDKATELIRKCKVATLTSINEAQYPRTCLLSIIHAEDFHDVFFITSKRSPISGKTTHFEANPHASVCYFLNSDSVTLVGDVSFVTDRSEQEPLWREEHRAFFKNGLDDPKLRIIHFHTREATFWIERKFRTVEYK